MLCLKKDISPRHGHIFAKAITIYNVFKEVLSAASLRKRRKENGDRQINVWLCLATWPLGTLALYFFSKNNFEMIKCLSWNNWRKKENFTWTRPPGWHEALIPGWFALPTCSRGVAEGFLTPLIPRSSLTEPPGALRSLFRKALIAKYISKAACSWSLVNLL